MSPSRSRGGGGGGAQGAAGLRLLADQLGRVPPELQKALRPELRRAAEQIKSAAASNASWSTRIPRSLRVGVRFGSSGQGVFIRAAASVAPHARPYEGITSRGGTFRHPVFGHRDRWVPQQARPFLAPAAESGRDDAVAAVERAIDEAARRAGFR